MTLVNFNKNYVNICAGIYHRLFTSPEWNYDWLTIENTRRYFKDLSSAPRFKGYVYLSGVIPVGCCLGEISDYFKITQYTIREIFIDPLLQNKGLGSGFLREIEADLKKNKVDSVSLSTSRRIVAHHFYKKNGYAESPAIVLMAKLINHPG